MIVRKFDPDTSFLRSMSIFLLDRWSSPQSEIICLFSLSLSINMHTHTYLPTWKGLRTQIFNHCLGLLVRWQNFRYLFFQLEAQIQIRTPHSPFSHEPSFTSKKWVQNTTSMSNKFLISSHRHDIIKHKEVEKEALRADRIRSLGAVASCTQVFLYFSAY